MPKAEKVETPAYNPFALAEAAGQAWWNMATLPLSFNPDEWALAIKGAGEITSTYITSSAKFVEQVTPGNPQEAVNLYRQTAAQPNLIRKRLEVLQALKRGDYNPDRDEGTVIFKAGAFELRYLPHNPNVPAEKVKELPLLWNFAYMNKWYVMQLAKGKGMIEYFQNQGFDNYVWSLNNPGIESHSLSLDKIALHYIPLAIRKSKEHLSKERGSQVDYLTLIGWCQASYAICARLGAEGLPDLGVPNLLLLTPPLGFKDKLLPGFARQVNAGKIDFPKLLAITGNMPGELVNWGAQDLDPIKTRISGHMSAFINALDEFGEPNGKFLRSFAPMYGWVGDLQDIPRAYFDDFVRHGYQKNNFAEGRLVLTGHKGARVPTCFGNIRQDTFVVIAGDDDIAPPPSTLEGTDQIPNKIIHFIKGGKHIGSVTGKGAPVVWATIGEWLGPRSNPNWAKEWLKKITTQSI